MPRVFLFVFFLLFKFYVFRMSFFLPPEARFIKTHYVVLKEKPSACSGMPKIHLYPMKDRSMPTELEPVKSNKELYSKAELSSSTVWRAFVSNFYGSMFLFQNRIFTRLFLKLLCIVFGKSLFSALYDPLSHSLTHYNTSCLIFHNIYILKHK